VNPITANFDALYAETSDIPVLPKIDETLMIAPDFFGNITTLPGVILFLLHCNVTQE
jgi:hypothetical protein